MAASARDAYLETKIDSADPVELVRMLYRGAMSAVSNARMHLAGGEIPQRSAAITKAIEILTELNGSLDHRNAPELSLRLAELYDYLQRRLLDANFRQADQPLAEVLKLLETLAEAWNALPAPRAAVRESIPYTSPLNSLCADPPEPALQSWCF